MAVPSKSQPRPNGFATANMIGLLGESAQLHATGAKRHQKANTDLTTMEQSSSRGDVTQPDLEQQRDLFGIELEPLTVWDAPCGSRVLRPVAIDARYREGLADVTNWHP